MACQNQQMNQNNTFKIVGNLITIFTSLLIMAFIIIQVLKMANINSFDELIGRRTNELMPIYQVPYNLSITADGGVQVTLPTDGLGLTYPGCLDINSCEWKARARTTVIDGDETVVIEAELEEGGQVIGRVQHMQVNSAEYEQLEALAKQGYDKVWVSHIEVVEPLWGNGIGHAMWKAGDIFLKLYAGSGAVHIFADQAGWGPAIMKYVPVNRIIMESDKLWAYLIQ